MIRNPRRSRLREHLDLLFVTLQSLIQQRPMTELISKAFRLWRRAGATGVWRQLRRLGYATFEYARWVEQYDTLSDADRSAIRKHIESFQHRPTISVLMPTYNPPGPWLQRAIESVRNQLYSDWELCIADDASEQPHVRAILEKYQKLDKRIKVVFRDRNGHISAASNSALELAIGSFIALLDHDDELSEHSLYMVALAIQDAPDLNLIYSDEDKIDEFGRRFGPYFKPDWNPDLLKAQNLISHLGVYRTSVIRSIGGFRSGVEGAQDWDLALRVVEQIQSPTIRHIPEVLYHWRAISGSTALSYEEKTYVTSAAKQVVSEHVQRICQTASVESAFSSFVRVRYPVPTPAPLISLILLGNPTNPDEVIRRTRYPALEIISCPGDNDENLARSLNSLARQSRGELLCFLYAALMPDAEDWLEELTGQAKRSEIGAVGPMQLDASGMIQSALTVLCRTAEGNRVSRGFYQGMSSHEKGMSGRAALQQNVTILAQGCLILRTETFNILNGFDDKNFPNSLFELDLCLRLDRAGYRNLWTPYARVISTAALGTGPCAYSLKEIELFHRKWQDYLDHDPTHNPNLTFGDVWPVPAYPPRTTRAWRPELKIGLPRSRNTL